MVFDPSLPSNSTKLRLAPDVIKNNWVAIEGGLESFKPVAINFNNRTPLSSVTDEPNAIKDTYIAFCKTDSLGNSELFGTSFKGDVSQLTQLTKGVPTVNSIGNTFLPGGLILSWGAGVFDNYSTISPSGITTLYQVVITIDDSSKNPSSKAYVFNITQGTFQVKLPSGRTSLRYMAIGV